MVLKLDPELAAELKAHPEYSAPPPPPRKASRSARTSARCLTPHSPRSDRHTAYAVEDHRVPVEGGEITVRSLVPTGEDSTATFPVLVWFHGGGWIVGDLDTDDNHLRTLCVKLQLAIVSVDYRLVPEYTFPNAHEDCYAALQWVVTHAPELRISLAKGFLVGGDSAGGNIAAATALRARDDPFFATDSGRGLTGQYLREPVLLHPEAVPAAHRAELRSYVENADAPLVDSKAMAQSFVGYNAPPTDVRVSPVLAETHAGLPPAFLQINECDPLRDEGLLYERLLREAGCATRLVSNPGCAHGTHYWFPGIAATAKIVSDEEDGLRWLLSFTNAG
ncbi:alpha/beta-hydrolase [Daedaleopsis nitida]|nr:alpha/beta-hydrolase [Daedaleopsis nitida]